MTAVHRLLSGLRALVRRRRDDADLNDELRAYLDAEIDARVAEGEDRTDATRAARAGLGSPLAIRDRVHDVGWEMSLEQFWADVREAARGLRWSPGFTIGVVITLALGIGVNVAMFTLLDTVLLRPLALPAPHELVVLHERGREGEPDTVGGTGRFLRFSYARYQLLQQALGANGALAASSATFDVGARSQGAADDRRLDAQLVSGNYFAILGVSPLRGRLLLPLDDAPNAPTSAVISARFWRSAFAASDTAVGQPLVVNGGMVATIVGITPDDFVGGWADQQVDLWMPVTQQFAVGYRNESSAYTSVDLGRSWLDQEISWLRVIGRVPGGERLRAEALLKGANRQGLEHLASAMDASQGASMLANTLVVEPFARGFSGLRAQYASLIVALMLLVGLLLLLTCANIAGLFLVRAGRRAREVTIRAALGATAGRIARRCLAESLLLAGAGGVAGCLAGSWVKTTLALQVMGTSRQFAAGFALDWRIVVFAAGITLTTAAVFGLAPTVHAFRLGHRAPSTLNQRSGDGMSGLRGLRPIVVLQLALSVVVVFSATLLGRTLVNLSRLDPGFDREHVIGAYFNLAAAGYSSAEAPAVRERLLAAATSVPGVVSSAIATCGLLSNCSYSNSVHLGGAPKPLSVNLNWVGPGYFSTIGRPLVRGREFVPADASGAKVAVITESLANRWFSGREPLGARLGFGEADTTIVGVVRDARSRQLREAPVAMVFLLVNQPPPKVFRFAPGTLEIRLAGSPRAMIPIVRDALRGAEPRVAFDVQWMSERLARQFERERAVAGLASGFALLALLLAAIGLYGVLADGVDRRTREIGVRMALGADTGQVITLIVRQGAVLTVLGLAGGLLVAPWVTRYLQGMLFEISRFDPWTFITVALVLAVISALASYLPVRRATRVDPVVALRAE
jgi:predicted permease